MISRRRLLLGLGAGLSGVGLTATGAYTAVEAPRTTVVGVANDPDAYLGLDGYADSTKTPTFTNNSSYSMSITLTSPDDVEFDVGTDGNWVAPPVTFSLASGATTEVNIRTGGCSGGTASVSASANLLDGGTNVGAIDLTRTWDIPQSGQIDVTANVTSSGASGKYEFELENTGCVDVTITGLGIKETTATATEVSGGDILLSDTEGQVVSNTIPIDNSDPDDATVREFSPNVTIVQNATETFEFDKFQDLSGNGGGNSKVDMRGEDVRITMTFSDGSSAAIKLCDGPCDF